MYRVIVENIHFVFLKENHMGIWGSRIFDNDDAMDFIEQIMPVKDISTLRDVLYQVVEPQHYLELPVCCTALAAVVLIAAMKNKDYSLLPEFARRWAIDMNFSINAQLIGLAQNAIQAIATESELQDLWSKSDIYNDWIEVIVGLNEKLNSTDLLFR
jgi:hypothetical protein